ncbi:unnamed protein product [Mycetohabitans rhizoxinica HKI 454]|uniref:Uncharacterized protein n=1 Tax=Mycetohabitans rhizoxinica (strain DSM 19002 / CIP 109453 / HKI 454) TaxID=882378 RepID=E5APV1_MYCRK|nr:unnamed protein product [Mycetohabitans rhizoxinica HKI 454]
MFEPDREPERGAEALHEGTSRTIRVASISVVCVNAVSATLGERIGWKTRLPVLR